MKIADEKINLAKIIFFHVLDNFKHFFFFFFSIFPTENFGPAARL